MGLLGLSQPKWQRADTLQRRGLGRGFEGLLSVVRVLAKYDHSNVTMVYDFFKANGPAFIVVRYELGESLFAYLEHLKRPQEQKVREILFPFLRCLRMLRMKSFLSCNVLFS